MFLAMSPGKVIRLAPPHGKALIGMAMGMEMGMEIPTTPSIPRPNRTAMSMIIPTAMMVMRQLIQRLLRHAMVLMMIATAARMKRFRTPITAIRTEMATVTPTIQPRLAVRRPIM